MALHIKGLNVDPSLALCLMVDISQLASSSLVTGYGDAELFYSEMLSAKKVLSENKPCSPFLIRTDTGKPLSYQIFTSRHISLKSALEESSICNSQGINLNLGCPAAKLKKSKQVTQGALQFSD